MLPIVATDVLLLLHVPPDVPDASLSVAFEPLHIAVAPVIAPAVGAGLTVTTAVAFTVPQLLATI